MTGNLTLQDIGELRLIDEIILPLARKYGTENQLGDDCSFVDITNGVLAVTADVGPRPLVQSLKYYVDDFEAAGWHAVVTTASDVASAGALPLFLTNCVDAPPDLPVTTIQRFMEGYFSACSTFGFRNAGGDVRQGPTLAARVFGAGKVQHDKRIGRFGVEKGDHLVVVGYAGRFMATYLLARSNDASVILPTGELLPEAASILRFPEPQLRSMAKLAERRLITAASDSSDGLLGAIDNISRASRCGFELNLEKSLLSSEVVSAAAISGYNPWNIFFCWGDWSVACTVKPSDFEEFEKVCAEEEIKWNYLGHATLDPGQLTAKHNNIETPIIPIRNENFVNRGFNAGLQQHLDHMLLTNLFP